MSDEKQQPEKPEQQPQSATLPGSNIPTDLEAARRAAGRGPNSAGPYRAPRRPAYSIMD